MKVEVLSATFTAFPSADAPEWDENPRDALRYAAIMLATLTESPVRVSYRVLRGKAARQAKEMFDLAAELDAKANDDLS